MQSGLFLLELYLDPHDAFGDGAGHNAILTVNGIQFCGLLPTLTASTVIQRVGIIRNVDDEVLFDNLTLETMAAADTGLTPCAPEPTTIVVWGGLALVAIYARWAARA
jgi:hypothetical protein